ncbi:hypothetical protein AQJ11_44430 [Streptomyces corchorusii]|uniref:Uncharacterized protein n=1 Tax=Streptomyces corchorusii TaxID=1903 RepID=A0A101PN49_STRCK|nr:hypothetical protein AQJ11_44430 [Streptomyces corchorusii]
MGPPGHRTAGAGRESPRFFSAAAEQWLRDLDKLPEPVPVWPFATVTFKGGPVIRVYSTEPHSPALRWSGGTV